LLTAASSARAAWAATSTAERSELLRAVGTAVRENLGELVEAEIAETGKLVAHARAEMLSCADYFEYYAAVARTMHGPSHRGRSGLGQRRRHDPGDTLRRIPAQRLRTREGRVETIGL